MRELLVGAMQLFGVLEKTLDHFIFLQFLGDIQELLQIPGRQEGEGFAFFDRAVSAAG